MQTLAFTKMHGLGNDFVVIDDLLAKATAAPLTPDLARKLCDRRFGIGADQLLWLRPAEGADLRMEILNADGSTAEMCGNGIRAVALYVDSRIKERKPRYRIETLGGMMVVEVVEDSSGRGRYGAPRSCRFSARRREDPGRGPGAPVFRGRHGQSPRGVLCR